MPKMIVESTWCYDPNATHYVEGVDLKGDYGTGIMGYYTNEIDAWRVAKHLVSEGLIKVKVLTMKSLSTGGGIHPLVEEFGYEQYR